MKRILVISKLIDINVIRRYQMYLFNEFFGFAALSGAGIMIVLGIWAVVTDSALSARKSSPEKSHESKVHEPLIYKKAA
jgi:hypothetical protein